MIIINSINNIKNYVVNSLGNLFNYTVEWCTGTTQATAQQPAATPRVKNTDKFIALDYYQENLSSIKTEFSITHLRPRKIETTKGNDCATQPQVQEPQKPKSSIDEAKLKDIRRYGDLLLQLKNAAINLGLNHSNKSFLSIAKRLDDLHLLYRNQGNFCILIIESDSEGAFFFDTSNLLPWSKADSKIADKLKTIAQENKTLLLSLSENNNKSKSGNGFSNLVIFSHKMIVDSLGIISSFNNLYPSKIQAYTLFEVFLNRITALVVACLSNNALSNPGGIPFHCNMFKLVQTYMSFLELLFPEAEEVTSASGFNLKENQTLKFLREFVKAIPSDLKNHDYLLKYTQIVAKLKTINDKFAGQI